MLCSGPLQATSPWQTETDSN